jgi:ADP-heptose:LPS heptosyltransferase
LSNEREGVYAAQIEALLQRLSDATVRIAELETSERRLESELRSLDQKTTHALARLASVNVHDQIYPAHAMSGLLRTLTVVQRRDLWIDAVQPLGLLGRPTGSLYPHDGGTDPLTILVCGSGGFGDMIYLSMVVRSLAERFAPARIVVQHEHPGAGAVFAANPYVLDVLTLAGREREEFLNVAASLDIFDLIADVRYVVSYAAPPLSRIPQDFLLAAHSRAAEWQKYVRGQWPFLNNIFAREVTRRGMTKYDLVGYTANLDVAGEPFGDVFPGAGLPAAIAARLGRVPYITVHTGSDPNMAGSNGLQTKNMPPAVWDDILSVCAREGFRTVQLGESGEAPMAGVDVDLRGQTSFDQTALVIKCAQAHIDTEGGLVHLAAAMGTRSAVAFGPTPVSFFGYRQNVNVGPSVCGDCWWTTREWSMQCPRDLPEPECMTTQSGTAIAEAAVSLARRRKALSAPVISQPAPNDVAAFAAVEQWLESRSGRGALIVDDAATLERILASPKVLADAVLFVPGGMMRDPRIVTGAVVRPFSNHHVPGATDSFAWALLFSRQPADEVAILLAEAARITGPRGYVGLFLRRGEPVTGRDMEAALGRMPGARLAAPNGSSAAELNNRIAQFTVQQNDLKERLLPKIGRMAGVRPALAEG